MRMHASGTTWYALGFVVLGLHGACTMPENTPSADFQAASTGSSITFEEASNDEVGSLLAGEGQEQAEGELGAVRDALTATLPNTADALAMNVPIDQPASSSAFEDVWSNREMQSFGQWTAYVAGGIGAGAGAALGAHIGSAFGPVGTAVGGVAGGILGGAAPWSWAARGYPTLPPPARHTPPPRLR